MRLVHSILNRLVRRPGVAVLAVMLCCAQFGLADRFPPDPVEALRQMLKAPPPHPDLAQRAEALRSLAEIRRALALQEWRSAVGGSDEQIYAALAERFKKEARRSLTTGSTAVRLAVMDMLAEIGSSLRDPQNPNGLASSLAPELANLVKNGETPHIREQAARALGLVFPDPNVALPALLHLLASPNFPERLAAGTALGNMLRVTNQLSSKAGEVEAVRVPRDYVVQLGKAILPVIAVGLSNPDPEVRRLAAGAAEQLGSALDTQVPQPRIGEEAIDPLAERKELGSVQHDLMPLLEAFSQQKAVLAKALQDDDLQVRLLVQRTLESLGNARLKLLRIATPNAAPAGASEPGKAQNAPPEGGLLAVAAQNQGQPTSAPDPLLRAAQAALPRLAADVTNPDVQIRLGAVEALESFGSAAAPAVPALIDATGDPNSFVRWAAGRTLGKMNPAEPTAVPALARLLFDRDFDVRLAACTALDRYGPAAKDAVPALIRAIRASDPDIRIAAMRTLGGIGTDAQPAIPALAAALSDRDERVRQTAADILAKFGPQAQSAAPALRKALDDPDADVRRAASDALLSVLQGEK
ncbi:MAG TPA: HEAT repeat domain-containing protein [Gemmataceae bacterium]|nr:HEAT repeat domain-containing protein [Gemmataceae bacterium]